MNLLNVLHNPNPPAPTTDTLTEQNRLSTHNPEAGSCCYSCSHTRTFIPGCQVTCVKSCSLKGAEHLLAGPGKSQDMSECQMSPQSSASGCRAGIAQEIRVRPFLGPERRVCAMREWRSQCRHGKSFQSWGVSHGQRAGPTLFEISILPGMPLPQQRSLPQ